MNDKVAAAGWKPIAIQSGSEADLIRAVHRFSTAGAIVNPRALMAASWSLRDAPASCPPPRIEVHLSNVWARKQFRHQSVPALLAQGVVV